MRPIAIVLAVAFSGIAVASPGPQIGMVANWPDSPTIVSGRASFYGEGFTGRKTASGERFHHQTISAASNRFPLGTVVAVRRPLSARCVVVKINDRMGHRSRLIDLSREAAARLGMIDVGVTDVQVVRVPEILIGHEQACILAFMPPVHLRVGAGASAEGEEK
ncbi:MAG TPA: septal ring lytic transglycosylase RlpA family protein [Accumulibacter sp.]|jgi:rare lipoprotein A|nr:septal ring lytic transglycosylase RlpA family protein [Accumulibacter sp.]HQC79336.1 septal ring lytic transglycosylase RlpA family protein [Accumulibacter sp.]